MDYLSIIQQYVNMQAVVVAVVVTQGLKYFLPSPPGTIGKSFLIEAGKWWTRAMPFVPVALGFVFCYFIEKDSKYIFGDAVKGILSGALASYLYTTTRVSIFGE